MKERALSIAREFWSKKFRYSFFILLIVGALTATGTSFTNTPEAVADTCRVEKGTWNLKSAGVTVARVNFGATICEENGVITRVAPIFEGGTDGLGSMSGWQFASQGVWTAWSGPHGVKIEAESTLKMCTPAGRLLPCSLTDRQKYTLVFYNTHGPYQEAPGFRLTSNTRFLGGGSAPQITFQRV